MRETPNFTGWHAVVLHREDGNTERLIRQLRLLGLSATLQWAPLSAASLPDLVIVDADQGFDDLLPWSGGAATRPVIALLGSEAPGRIAWALSQGTGAIIPKPIAASAVYPALVMALSIHQERKGIAERLQYLEERVRLRPLVHAAVEKLMKAHAVDEERAYSILRNCAMRRRLPMEQIAAFIIGGIEPLPEAG
ncbi:AmiR/NasT family two-component response regulator [Rhizobium sp. BK650]|uniref:ANTAR domain-containing response regulator n=1 Tax=Rhizobium sp. BK650 TaxID=2586990 RepID=UPI001611B14B|nr:ANTAR domain-containing protein [Rhizobium sp. BK650]MBB3657793.1 AmiR/NasT family two-component response regulator [Rhizobium sp. BK650]